MLPFNINNVLQPTKVRIIFGFFAFVSNFSYLCKKNVTVMMGKTTVTMIGRGMMLLLLFVASPVSAQERAEVLLETTEGNIRIALYNETPLHRDNFLKVVGMQAL